MSGPARLWRPAVVVAGLAAAALLAAGPADAATGRPTQQVVCGGQVLTISVAPGNGGNNWGAGQVVDGGHLVVASLEYAVHDDTADLWLDDEVLAHGKAHAQQQTITCDVASQQAFLGDVAPPDFVYPAGTGPADVVTSSLRATVVPRP